MCPVLAVIATEIAVLAASSAPSDQAAAQAIERALSANGVTVIERSQVVAVRTSDFAPLAEARRLLAEARKHDLNVEFDLAEQAATRAIEILDGRPNIHEEIADAFVLRGIVRFHAHQDGTKDFSIAKSEDPTRQLSPLEVHPDIAAAYAAAQPPKVVHAPRPWFGESDRPDEICDLLWCDGVIVVGVSERNGRASLVGTRYDANARAFTERAVAGNARELIDSVLGSPAFAREQPSLVLPPEPPPPKVWQRTWFWTAVGGAAAALAGSLIYADATRDVHTNVSVPAGVFGGR